MIGEAKPGKDVRDPSPRRLLTIITRTINFHEFFEHLA